MPRGRKGWFKESARHGLAAKGIKTRVRGRLYEWAQMKPTAGYAPAKSERPSRALDEAFFSYAWRKATSWTEPGSFPWHIYSEFENEIESFPQYLIHPGHPLESFDKFYPQWYIAIGEEGRFLVDTEGFDYARYIVRLPDVSGKEARGEYPYGPAKGIKTGENYVVVMTPAGKFSARKDVRNLMKPGETIVSHASDKKTAQEMAKSFRERRKRVLGR